MSSFLASGVYSDITPIAQDDGPNPVVAIQYSQEFIELMNIFRGLVYTAEKSERALELTEKLLEINTASYTVWQYRRQCLKELQSSLADELDFMDQFAAENPKNYQIWQHRRCVAEWHNSDGQRELRFCEEIFAEDSKNYHAWAHRQWAVQHFNLWDGELDFIETMLEADIRNNSAWNHRFFVVFNHPTRDINSEVLKQEVQYTMEKLVKVRKNESAWNYLRGIVNYSADIVPFVYNWLHEFVQKSESSNYLAMGLLGDICQRMNSADRLQEAISCFEKLVTVDSIRSKSWLRRLGQAKAILSSMEVC